MQMTWIMFERSLPYVQWRDTPSVVDLHIEDVMSSIADDNHHNNIYL